MNPASIPDPASRRWLLPIALAVASLWPLVRNWNVLRSLFYYEDEWDLIDQWERSGFTHWMGTTFAENFVPLFKVLWGGAIITSGGNYLALLLLLWLTHAVNVFLLVRLATRLCGGIAGAALAGLVFGLAWVNYETLTWSVQWSAVLSLSFLLVGLELAARWSQTAVLNLWRAGPALAACVLASALCFSRGVLTGVALAAWAIGTPALAGRWKLKLALVAFVLAPAAAVGVWIFGHAAGNQHHLSEGIGAMARFALYYYAQAPLRALWSDETPALSIILIMALAKCALYVAGWRLAPRPAQAVLAGLVVFEICNALLLGVGRYHTGLPASGSSRYQYGALASLLPFCAVLFDRALAVVPRRRGLRMIVGAAVIFVAVRWIAAPWPQVLAEWVPSRGPEQRRILFHPAPNSLPELLKPLPWISDSRARELARKFQLH